MFGNRRIYDNHSESHFPNQTHTHINKNNYTIEIVYLEMQQTPTTIPVYLCRLIMIGLFKFLDSDWLIKLS